MKTRAIAAGCCSAVAAATLLFCAPASAQSFRAADPYFGPTEVTPKELNGTRPPTDPPGRPFREYVGHLEELLISRSLDAKQYVAQPPTHVDEGKKLVTEDIDHPFSVVAGIHLRKVGTTEQVLGTVTPSDTLFATQPGLLLMGRVGVEASRFTVFGVFGAGAYRALRWNVALDETAMQGLLPGTPALIWSGAVAFGVGAEWRVTPAVSFGAEYDVAQLTAAPSRGDVLWPNTADAIKTAVAAVRVEY